jgi:hypothetical protein
MKRLITLTVGALAFCSIALAQWGEEDGPVMRYDHAGAQCDLLIRADVQRDLNLSDRVVDTIRVAAKRRDAAMDVARTENAGDQIATDRTMDKLEQDYDTSAWRPLVRWQRQRAMQIFVQMGKGRALEDPEVQKDLHLDRGEVDQINHITHENRVANGTLFAEMNDGKLDREQLKAKRHENNLHLSSALLIVLTGEQKAAFDSMSGAPFTADPLIDDRTGMRVDQK